ncbi:hypothetical protein SAICODRAFT_20927 [Saitoella complicata NRRL Y-17804]|nr:uncharacterized protein SAICODRAFT_20927 [Saitoella complicata NRRL Y-17804]ODQ51218.1 hypothetical protein SAICODRAFT_20927 [Saitoella complicata NRRL Y-17804]
MDHGPDKKKVARLACLNCRQRKVKCCGTQPICERCKSQNLVCSWLPSQRGGARVPRKKDKSPENVQGGGRPRISEERSSPDESFVSFNEDHDMGVDMDYDQSYDYDLDEQIALLQQTSLNPSTTYLTLSPSTSTTKSPASSTPGTELIQLNYAGGEGLLPREYTHLIATYYAHFHHNHSFLLPHHLVIPRFRRSGGLFWGVLWVGSHFTHTLSPSSPYPNGERGNEAYLEDARAALEGRMDEEMVAEDVQALVLLAVGCYVNARREEAVGFAKRACEGAILLGLHLLDDEESASFVLAQSSVEKESMRRTWWTVWCVDRMFAALGGKSTARIPKDLRIRTRLPTSEEEYEVGQMISTVGFLEDFKRNMYVADTGYEWSPWAYLVAALENLENIIAFVNVPTFTLDDTATLEMLDNQLYGLAMRLPDYGASLLRRPPQMSGVLFFAHMVVNTTTLYLHSRFAANSLPFLVQSPHCGKCTHIPDLMHYNSSTIQSINRCFTAAHSLARLVRCSPLEMSQHTPFLMCGFSLSCLVDASAAAVGWEKEKAMAGLSVGIGGLRSFTKVWAGAVGLVDSVENAINNLRILEGVGEGVRNVTAADFGIKGDGPAGEIVEAGIVEQEMAM